ncbi:hypothetical protein [Serratia sp. DD3]|nr:hypothetical protein [Serratia sp. DD3]
MIKIIGECSQVADRSYQDPAIVAHILQVANRVVAGNSRYVITT